jgi:hypothetical protein
MSNFSNENGVTRYIEPRETLVYRGEIELSSEFDGDEVGLALSAYGSGNSVHVGLGGEADIQQFLYAAAVHSKLIADGEPLILMKRVTVDVEDDYEVR